MVQDARSDNGSEEIPAGVLEGIDRSDLFIADMTPVASVPNTNKLQPNANVIFEYGYALKSKGHRFTRLLTCLDANQAIEQLPFDINHRKMIKFHLDDKGISSVIKSWILSKMGEVIAFRKPVARAIISFEGGSDEITLRPLFKRKLYYKMYDEIENTSNILAVDVIISKIPSYADMLSIPKTTAKVVTASPITKDIHKSLLPVQFQIENLGNEVIENCNIHIWASNGNVSFKVENVHEKCRIYAIKQKDYHIMSDGHIVRHIDMINPEETFSS